jgi:hypothetical protein
MTIEITFKRLALGLIIVIAAIYYAMSAIAKQGFRASIGRLPQCKQAVVTLEGRIYRRVDLAGNSSPTYLSTNIFVRAVITDRKHLKVLAGAIPTRHLSINNFATFGLRTPGGTIDFGTYAMTLEMTQDSVSKRFTLFHGGLIGEYHTCLISPDLNPMTIYDACTNAGVPFEQVRDETSN